jgi:hypothetical protein
VMDSRELCKVCWSFGCSGVRCMVVFVKIFRWILRLSYVLHLWLSRVSRAILGNSVMMNIE